MFHQIKINKLKTIFLLLEQKINIKKKKKKFELDDFIDQINEQCFISRLKYNNFKKVYKDNLIIIIFFITIDFKIIGYNIFEKINK